MTLLKQIQLWVVLDCAQAELARAVAFVLGSATYCGSGKRCWEIIEVPTMNAYKEHNFS